MLSVLTCKTQPMVWSPRRAMTLVLGLATGATVATCLWGARQEYVRPTDIGQGRTQNADVRTYVNKCSHAQSIHMEDCEGWCMVVRLS